MAHAASLLDTPMSDQTYRAEGLINLDLSKVIITGLPGFVSPLTTKGDIYGRTALADARVPVGANGSVLTADSVSPLGVSWQPGGTPFGWKDVKRDFGAVGDGITDDWTVIQAGITAQPIGTVIVFPPGTYALSQTLTTNTRCILLGSGRECSVLLALPGFIGQWVVELLTEETGMVDLDVDGGGNAQSGVRLASGQCFVCRSRIHDNGAWGLRIGGSGTTLNWKLIDVTLFNNALGSVEKVGVGTVGPGTILDCNGVVGSQQDRVIVASAATINVSAPVIEVTGAVLINNIAFPDLPLLGSVDIIPTAGSTWTISGAGNIVGPVMPVVGQVLRLTCHQVSQLAGPPIETWYPSYFTGTVIPVTTPPFVNTTLPANQDIASSPVSTAITWHVVQTQGAAIMGADSPTFTIPETGVYLFDVMCAWFLSGSGPPYLGDVVTEILINGVAVPDDLSAHATILVNTPFTNFVTQRNFSWLLTAGDIIQILVSQDDTGGSANGTALRLLAGAGSGTRAAVCRIG